jgi:hypothetical protein
VGAKENNPRGVAAMRKEEVRGEDDADVVDEG